MGKTEYVVSLQCGWYSMYHSGFQEFTPGCAVVARQRCASCAVSSCVTAKCRGHDAAAPLMLSPLLGMRPRTHMRACAPELRRRSDTRPRRAPCSHATVNSTNARNMSNAACDARMANLKAQRRASPRVCARGRLCAHACVWLYRGRRPRLPPRTQQQAVIAGPHYRSAPPQPCRARRGGTAAANHRRKQNLRRAEHGSSSGRGSTAQSRPRWWWLRL